MLVNSDKTVNSPQYSSLSKTREFSQKRKPSSKADVFFKADQNNKKYDNPIKSGFEYLDAAKLTAAAGLYIAFRFAIEFIDTIDFDKKSLKTLALVSLGIGAAAALLSLPKNLYKRKVDTFQKKKEMDVYVRANSAEQGLYERLDTEAQKADIEKKKELTQSYLKLKTGKNQLPEFIKEYKK